MRIEALERWQKLKGHGMSLIRYFGKAKIEVLCQDIESSMGIQLKTVPRLLISETRLKEYLESSNKKRSTMIITVGTSKKTVKLC